METTFEDPDTAVTVVTDLRAITGRHDTHPRQNGTDQTNGGDDTGLRAGTSLTAITDLHRSKIPADDPRLKIHQPKSRTLRRGPALAAALGLGGVVLVVLVVAASPSTPSADDDAKNAGDTRGASSDGITLPDMLRESAVSEAPPVQTPIAGLADPKGTTTETAPASTPAAQRAETFRQARFEEFLRARGGGIFPPIDDTPAGDPSSTSARSPSASQPISAEAKTPAIADSAAAATAGSGSSVDGNMQGRKNDFLAKSGGSSAEYLDTGMTAPRSPYELKAGTVIPTVLITGINSDLPGQVVGQVRENVYDTVSGNYLLIPQGSRILASYDSMVAWGQERVLICWNRVIRPDGTSITLNCMPGVDLAGYAGFSDQVDNHWWRIISGAAFSSLLAATAQRSQGDVTGFQPSFPQVWASGAAGQINQAGQQVTAKNLQIQPTITVRPGWSVNVLVSKDIILPPYHQGVSP